VTAPAEIARPTTAELEALDAGVGWFDDRRERLDLAGADRVRFLQNLVTCDLTALASGEAARGFLTLVRGGVLADTEIVALEDRWRLVVPPGRSGPVAEHLAKYRIADRVEIVARADLVALGVRGSRVGQLLAALAAALVEDGSRRTELGIAGRTVAMRRDPRPGPARFDLELASTDRDEVVAALRSAGAKLGLVGLSEAALEWARISAGELAWGVDYGEENFPQETGEESAVSYTKGCYLGQEVVARIHYRGGVQRLPRRMRFAVGSAVERGAELAFEGRPAGRVTSLASDPRSGELVGLGLLHRRAAEAGTLLDASGGVHALVEVP